MAFPRISNALATRLRKLHMKKYRTQFGQCILEGARIVQDAINDPARLDCIIVEDTRADHHTETLQTAGNNGIRIYTAEASLLGSLTSTEHSQGIIAIANIPAQPEALLPPSPGLVTVLHEINDPGNFGTIIRTCDWFNAPRILTSPGSADPFNPKTIRASMGSILRTEIHPFESYDTLFAAARVQGYTIAATGTQGAVPLHAFTFPKGLLLLFGSEAHGMPHPLSAQADTTISIPKFGGAESLNLAASHAILLSHYRCQIP